MQSPRHEYMRLGGDGDLGEAEGGEAEGGETDTTQRAEGQEVSMIDTRSLLHTEERNRGGVLPFADLDRLFTLLYAYYEGHGWWALMVARWVNLASLGFTLALSGFLLLCVDWKRLNRGCAPDDGHSECEILRGGVIRHPLSPPLSPSSVIVLIYLALFSLYWAVQLGSLLLDAREYGEVATFAKEVLRLPDAKLGVGVWAEVVDGIVRGQATTRFCAARHLDHADVVARIMRKENYFIGMLDENVLNLSVRAPPWLAMLVGEGQVDLLTTTMEFFLFWTILNYAFDRNFRIHPEFLSDPARLRARFREVAVANAFLSPFLLIFMLVYFFLKNAGDFYHQPSTLGRRSWSLLAQWRFREYNELPHLLERRLHASVDTVDAYLAQFPRPVVSICARFFVFVVGGLDALLLAIMFIEEGMVESTIGGRNLLWYAAVFTAVLAVSRSMAGDGRRVFEPGKHLSEVCKQIRHYPPAWRAKPHSDRVRREIMYLYQYTLLSFIWEMVGCVILTPLALFFVMPEQCDAIVAFFRDKTIHIPGVGDVCTLSILSMERDDPPSTESPDDAPSALRKVGLSARSFHENYHGWLTAQSHLTS